MRKLNLDVLRSARRRFLFGVAVATPVLFPLAAHATDTAGTSFDTGVDVGSTATAAMTAGSSQLGVVLGIAIALMVFGALWRWARSGVKSR